MVSMQQYRSANHNVLLLTNAVFLAPPWSLLLIKVGVEPPSRSRALSRRLGCMCAKKSSIFDVRCTK